MVQIVKSQCPMNREFPEFFKTHPTFICIQFLRPLGAFNQDLQNRTHYLAVVVVQYMDINTLGLLELQHCSC